MEPYIKKYSNIIYEHHPNFESNDTDNLKLTLFALSDLAQVHHTANEPAQMMAAYFKPMM